MKVIMIQDGNKLRLTMLAETSADAFMMKALRSSDGNQTKVIPVDTNELERVINPYRESGHSNGKSHEAVIIELTVDHFPALVEADEANKEFEIRRNGTDDGILKLKNIG
ncbi:MAG: hypothetical protein U0V74_17310 [Chitinophagales bacterium]